MSMITGFGLLGFEIHLDRGRYSILWDHDSAQPRMMCPGNDGCEITQPVANVAFHVPPGPLAKRRLAMRRAAVAFFAPLLEST